MVDEMKEVAEYKENPESCAQLSGATLKKKEFLMNYFLYVWPIISYMRFVW